MERPTIHLWYDYLEGCFRLRASDPLQCTGPQGFCRSEVDSDGHLKLTIDKKTMQTPQRIILRIHNLVMADHDLDLTVHHETLHPFEGEPGKVVICPNEATAVIIKKDIGVCPGKSIGFNLDPKDGCHPHLRAHAEIHVEC